MFWGQDVARLEMQNEGRYDQEALFTYVKISINK